MFRYLSSKSVMRAHTNHEHALQTFVSAVRTLIAERGFGDQTAQEQATEIVEFMVYERPDLWQRLSYGPASRVWYYPRGSVFVEDTPWFMWGGDEYGNRPLCVMLPFGGQLCVNLAPRLKNRVQSPSGEEVDDVRD